MLYPQLYTVDLWPFQSGFQNIITHLSPLKIHPYPKHIDYTRYIISSRYQSVNRGGLPSYQSRSMFYQFLYISRVPL